jgi:PPOX class probable FMN-dependent enzyme
MSDYTVTDVQTLREIYPEPTGVAVEKQLAALDQHCRNFIANSPFLVMGTDGDVSPKGDNPGFVQIVDDKTIVIPDRKGNNRMDSLQNILENPSVGILFMIPGVSETLRVNGRAEISIDPKIIDPLAVNGKPPASAIVVHIEEVYLHCAKALARSRIWSQDAHVAKGVIPPAGRIFADQVGADSAALEKTYDEVIAGALAEEGRT